MGFEIIKAEQRTASMLGWFAGICQKVTDFLVGSKIRTKFEAVAVEMEAQDYQMYVAIKKAIPTANYNAFGFPLLPAVAAYGQVTFSLAATSAYNTVIPAGTQVATVATSQEAERVYQTQAEAVIPAGQLTISADIVCTTAGIFGNTAANTITVIKTAVPNVSTVTNATSITTGTDQEIGAARQVRFQNFIASLTRGTSAALRYAALLGSNGTERVTDALVTEPPASGSAGSCSVYLYNGAKANPGASSQLVSRVQTIIDGDQATRTAGYKAAGVVVTVAAATVTAQNVTVAVTALPGYDTATVQAAVVSAINAYFDTMKIGGKFLYFEMAERIMGCEGVYNISVTAPTADVTPAATAVIIPGTITVTVT